MCIRDRSKKAPCKKTLQKIVYLIEEAGGPKKFDYTIDVYKRQALTYRDMQTDHTVLQILLDRVEE